MPITGGELYTLVPALTRSASGTGNTFDLGGPRRRMQAVVTFTGAAATDAGDVCDVYVDLSHDGSIWMNAVHFTQRAGNAGAGSTEFATLDSSNPGTSVIAVTSDAASGAVRPGLFGSYVRTRWTIVDANANAAHTFGVKLYVA